MQFDWLYDNLRNTREDTDAVFQEFMREIHSELDEDADDLATEISNRKKKHLKRSNNVSPMKNKRPKLAKFIRGSAYYIIRCPENYLDPDVMYDLTHLLSGKKFQAGGFQLQLVDWESIPESYQLDAVALNEVVRRHFGPSTSLNEYEDERDEEAQQNKRGNNMFDNIFSSNAKFMDRMFRKVDNVVWDLMSGRIGIVRNNEIVTMEGEGKDAQVNINVFDQFGMKIPAFAQNVPREQVRVGDLIMGAKDVIGWIVETPKEDEKSFRVLKLDGTRSTWSPPKVQIFGFESGIMVLRSLMGMLPNGQNGLASMQSMLMPMMFMNGGDEDGEDMNLDKLIPLMLMSQMGGIPGADPTAAGAANPMGNMLPMIMMMQMMKKK